MVPTIYAAKENNKWYRASGVIKRQKQKLAALNYQIDLTKGSGIHYVLRAKEIRGVAVIPRIIAQSLMRYARNADVMPSEFVEIAEMSARCLFLVFLQEFDESWR